MATTKINLGDSSVGVEQTAPIGQAFNGEHPAGALSDMDQSRDVVSWPDAAAGQAGLFSPEKFIVSRIHAFCTAIQIISGPAVTWKVYVTSGLRDGTAVEYDSPLADQEIAAGTGSTHVRVNIELLPGQNIRVTAAAAAVVPTRVITHLSNVIGAGGRLNA